MESGSKIVLKSTPLSPCNLGFTQAYPARYSSTHTKLQQHSCILEKHTTAYSQWCVCVCVCVCVCMRELQLYGIFLFLLLPPMCTLSPSPSLGRLVQFIWIQIIDIYYDVAFLTLAISFFGNGSRCLCTCTFTVFSSHSVMKCSERERERERERETVRQREQH